LAAAAALLAAQNVAYRSSADPADPADASGVAVGFGVAEADGGVELGESVAAVVEHAASAVAMSAVPN